MTVEELHGLYFGHPGPAPGVDANYVYLAATCNTHVSDPLTRYVAKSSSEKASNLYFEITEVDEDPEQT